MPYVVGLISGTSLDGIDAALVEFCDKKVRLISFLTLPMEKVLRQKIIDTCSINRSNIALTCSLNVELGYAFAKAAKEVCSNIGFDIHNLDCIGSHGQTVYHIPNNEGMFLASTLQLGDPAIIAYETNVPVVSSFRAMDMAAGGRGAPLVPYIEYLIYRGEKSRALQNLGGIGNVTVLPKNCRLDQVMAFDTGPANMIINELCQKLFGFQYDDAGAIAATGRVVESILEQWMAIPYITQQPPKATGRELFGVQFTEKALHDHPGIAPQDWLCTATKYTALSIAENYRRFVFPYCDIDEIILGGGGSHNETLVNMIRDLLSKYPVKKQEDLGFSSDAKEAVAFAFLAHETMRGRIGNAPNATGAKQSVILGNITPALFNSNSHNGYPFFTDTETDKWSFVSS